MYATLDSRLGDPGTDPRRQPFHPVRRKKGVLVIDVSPAIRDLLDMSLRLRGLAVWKSAGGGDALTVFRLNVDRIDLVLLNIDCPGSDALYTLAAIRLLNPRVPVRLMKGSSSGCVRTRNTDPIIRDAITKPYSLAEVSQAVEELLLG